MTVCSDFREKVINSTEGSVQETQNRCKEILPLIKIVQEKGFLTFSMNVYFSSPRTCSYTKPAQPRHSGVKSSTEFTASPPQAKTSLSMFLLFALRRAII